MTFSHRKYSTYYFDSRDCAFVLVVLKKIFVHFSHFQLRVQITEFEFEHSSYVSTHSAFIFLHYRNNNNTTQSYNGIDKV